LGTKAWEPGNGPTELREVSSIETSGFLSRNGIKERSPIARSRIRDRTFNCSKSYYEQAGGTIERKFEGVASTMGILKT
jgi:hypothetical protein